MAFRLVLFLYISMFLVSCITPELRTPATIHEVYSNSEMRQSLLMMAQNKILFHIPEDTLNESEKSEVDMKCKKIESPFWAEKLSVYLNVFKFHPELLYKFHILEIKKGDEPSLSLKSDRDGVSVLTIRYGKFESRGKLGLGSKLPCDGNLAEYIGREIIMTQFDFPTIENLKVTLENAPDRTEAERFNFKNDFLIFLAERGALLKFNHDLSFEKLPTGQYVMATVLNKYADDIKKLDQKKQKKSYINLWLKKINENSKQAQLIQFFGLEGDKQLRKGIKVSGDDENIKIKKGLNTTYLYNTYFNDDAEFKMMGLDDLDDCLAQLTEQMGMSFFRKPASENEKENYLSPGFHCLGEKAELKEP